MRDLERFVAGILLAVAIVAAPAFAQLAPLVPLDDPAVHDPLLPAGISRNKPEMFGDYAHIWSLDDGTHVIQYYGDFAMHLGSRRLKSRDAVIWMQKSVWKNVSYYHFEILLSGQARVRDSGGTVTTGPLLLVTLNSTRPAAVEAGKGSDAWDRSGAI